jgi:hypothetical protein
MRPRTLAADIVLLDRIGSWHQLTLSVPMM